MESYLKVMGTAEFVGPFEGLVGATCLSLKKAGTFHSQQAAPYKTSLKPPKPFPRYMECEKCCHRLPDTDYAL